MVEIGRRCPLKSDRGDFDAKGMSRAEILHCYIRPDREKLGVEF
jgi:hypothetical protein